MFSAFLGLRGSTEGGTFVEGALRDPRVLFALCNRLQPSSIAGLRAPGGGCTSLLLPGPVGAKPPWQDPAATRGAGSPVAAAGMHAPSSRKGQGLLPITPPSLPVPARHRGREDKEGRFSPWRGNRSYNV